MAVARLPPLSGGKVLVVSAGADHQHEALKGPTYRLSDRIHPLPPPTVLKPYMDTKPGELDTWPAHASHHSLSTNSAMLSKNKSLVLVNKETAGKSSITPKPRFLEQLEHFLRSELKALGVTDVRPSDLRLQAHREVFQYLIEDFKTYKPLLSAIKNEYEMMLTQQRQQIRQLEPLRQMLVTVSEQCEHKIMALREDERGDMMELKKEKRELYNQISSLMKQQNDLREQIQRLQLKLEEEYHKYRDECDARKLLVADINDLRYQQEDYLASRAAAEQNLDTDEDPIVVKLALQKSREAEMAASQKLNEMIANYGDVVPRRDFEMLETKFKEQEQQLQVSLQDFRQLQAEHNSLLDVQRQVVQKRDEFYIELETLKRSSTPRPVWDKCADCVCGGIVRWKELSEGKSSNDLVDLLLGEIQSGGFVDSSAADYFDPQGTGPEVPAYLRHDQPVRNRRLSKRDTTLIIRDIWRTKSAKDAERTDGSRQKMADFMFEYLKSHFPLEQIGLEWGYNLHDACQRFSHDPAINLFWKVLHGEADEEVFHSQLLTIHGLLTHMMKLDEEQANQGTLSLEDFRKCLIEFFKLSGQEDEDTTAAIMTRAAVTELELSDGQAIDYRSLFMEDDEGRTGQFLDEVKKFMKTQKETYISDIQENLSNSDPVSVDTLMRAVSMADPEISYEKMQEYLRWAFNTSSEGLQDASPVPQATILERMANGNIFRVGSKM